MVKCKFLTTQETFDYILVMSSVNIVNTVTGINFSVG